jgi:predicted RNase H-like HicB family nuclease
LQQSNLETIPEVSAAGGYTVYVPTLPSCMSEGDTLEDALQSVREQYEQVG